MKFSKFKYFLLALLVIVILSISGVWWCYAHLTDLVQSRLKEIAGSDITLGKVTARWNRVELSQVRVARRGAGTFDSRFSVDSIVIRPSLLSLFRGCLEIREIIIEKPYLLLEINPDGTFAKILPPAPVERQKSTKPQLPVHLGSLSINNGTIDLLDWQVASKGVTGLSNPADKYHLTTLNNVLFSVGAFTIPVSGQSMPVKLEMKGKGGGKLLIAGDIAPKGLDSHLKLDLKSLNILPYRPYFIKKGDLDISAGNLSANCQITINKRILNAPGSLQLKGLTFDSSSAKSMLMGVPAAALVGILSDSKDNLSVTFSVNGSLDNPKFSIRQSLIDQLATSLSSKMGISTVSTVGKGILDTGKKGIKGLFGIK